MHKEMDLVNVELEQLAPGVMNTFLQRRDLYAKQLDNGSYICIKKPLTQKHVIAHLSGDLTLGAYVLDQESRAKYIVFDADDPAQFQTLTSMHSTLEGESIPAYLEASRRGGHLWIFFSQPVPGKDCPQVWQRVGPAVRPGKNGAFPQAGCGHQRPRFSDPAALRHSPPDRGTVSFSVLSGGACGW